MSLSLGALSYLRVFAAIGIVCFHTAGDLARIPGGASLVVFLLLSFMMSCHTGSASAGLRRRSARILIPWVAWWLLYAGYYVVRGFLKSSPPNIPPTVFFFLIWPAMHLWYLPFVFVHANVLQFLSNRMRRFDRRLQIVLATTAGVCTSLAIPSPDVIPYGIAAWVIALPAVGFGAAFGLCLQAKSQNRMLGFLYVVLNIHFAAWILFYQGNRVVSLCYFLGSTAMLVCLLPIRRNALILYLSRLSMGVYLIHPFGQIVVFKLFGPTIPIPMAVGLIIGISALAVALMRRTPYLRSLV